MSRKSGSGSGYRQRKLVVENLERRSMLAGNVFVSVSGGSLIIRGDDKDNAILVSDLGGGTYAVTGGDFGEVGDLADQGFQSGPTVIKGGEETDDPNTRIFTGVTNDINIDMKKGDDLVAMGNSVEDLDALARECFGFGFGEGSGGGSGSGNGTSSGSVSSTAIEVVSEHDGTFQVPRNLIVNTGDGNDYVIANANVGSGSKGGVASINTGNGHDGVAFGSPFSFAPMEEVDAQVESEFGVHVELNLVILTGSGDDHVCVQNVQVDNLLSIQTGDGHDGVEAGHFIAGLANVITGNGNDEVEMFNFALDHSLVVNTGAGHDDVLIEGFSAGDGDGPSGNDSAAGVITVVTGAGDDGVIVAGFTADAIVIDTGAGNDGSATERDFDDISAQDHEQSEFPIIVAEGFLTRGLTLVTGAGNDYVEVEFVTASDITINTGAGNDGSYYSPISVYGVEVKNNLVVVTGEGHDYAYLYSGFDIISEVGGSVVVNMGGGNDLVGIVDFDIAKDLTVVLGSGNDGAGIGTTEGFADGSTQGTLRVGRNLVLDAGTGNDEVAAANLEVHNDIFAYLGSGKDFLDFYNSTVGGNAFIDAGADNDSVYIEEVDVGGKASVYMGAGNDTLSIYSSSAKSLYLRGRAGKDTFNNDIGIESNGKEGDADVAEFEVFNEPA
jgi:hypothetical protein